MSYSLKFFIMEKYQSTISYDDIIFDGRNQAYGAYQLRKMIDRHHLSAIFITFFIFLVFILFFKWKLGKEIPISPFDGVVVVSPTEIPIFEDIPLKEVVETSPPVTRPQSDMQRYVEYTILPDAQVNSTQNTTVESVLNNDANIGYQDIDGLENVPIIVDVPANDAPMGPNSQNVSDVDAFNPNIIHDIVQVQPEFPGGTAALYKFLGKHLKFTEVAIQNNISGTVIVQFVVERDGSISNIEVIKEPGGGLGNEAIRVMKLMPKWKPGLQNNTSVRVKMRAPIKFQYNGN